MSTALVRCQVKLTAHRSINSWAKGSTVLLYYAFSVSVCHHITCISINKMKKKDGHWVFSCWVEVAVNVKTTHSHKYVVCPFQFLNSQLSSLIFNATVLD